MLENRSLPEHVTGLQLPLGRGGGRAKELPHKIVLKFPQCPCLFFYCPVPSTEQKLSEEIAVSRHDRHNSYHLFDPCCVPVLSKVFM